MRDALLADVMTITPESTVPDVLRVAEAVLDRSDEKWESRLQLLLALTWRAVPDMLGIHLYRADPPGVRLTLAASQGGPAALSMAWHQGLVGTSASDRAVQIVPYLRVMFAHEIRDPRAQSALAVPVTRHGVQAVVLVTATERDRVGVLEAELVQALAGAAAARWPIEGHEG